MKTLTNAQKTILIIIVSLFATVVALSIIGLFENDQQPEPVTNVQQEENTLRGTVQSEYMKGCTDGSTSMYDFCDCTQKILIENSTTDEIIDMTIEYSETGELTNEMIEAIDQCIHEIE